MKRSTQIGLVVAVISALVFGWYALGRDSRTRAKRLDQGKELTADSPPAPESSSTTANQPVDPSTTQEAAAGGSWVKATWGSRRGELGRDRPAEGNPEGPMSFAVRGRGLYVVDQVNGRLVRYDARGNLLGSSTIPDTVQDVAVGKDGTTALLDRLAGKTVSLTDASGRRIGELPLAGLGDTGNLTGVFIDGKDVYVEQDHGGLVSVGTTDGQPATAPLKELGGRPSKDGSLLLNAALAAPSDGKVTLNAIDRSSNELRFARLVQVSRPASAIVLLDTDASGTIYLGVDAGEPETANVVCMAPSDGHVVGRVNLPLSDTPEESFRDFAVDDDGTIVFTLRTEQGATYATARCP